MARSWSSEAQAALDAYPWTSPAEKAKARAEAELVAFGQDVECDDLPLAVRRWLKRQTRPRHVWRGETLKEATAAFEVEIISQALAAVSMVRLRIAPPWELCTPIWLCSRRPSWKTYKRLSRMS